MESIERDTSIVKTQRYAAFVRPQQHKLFGHWRYNPNNDTLTFRGTGRPDYEIDLDHAKTAEDVLDWVWHCSEKFCSDDMADLLEAFREIRGHLVYGKVWA